MRIIAGRLRRRQFKAPKGDATRPTTDRVRESLFNLLESRMAFAGVRVLDLFSGTGSLSFEAISRGAERATMVEANGHVVRVAQKNAMSLGIADVCTFVRTDAVAFVERYAGPPLRLVFADPPYELPDLQRLPDLVLAHLAPDGLFALEHDRRHDFADHPACLLVRPYGRTTVSLFGGAERLDA